MNTQLSMETINIESLSPSQIEVLQGMLMERRVQLLQVEISELKNETEKLKSQREIDSKELETVQHRLDNFDLVNVDGDPQQRLNSMIRKYAADKGIRFDLAWKEFRQAYDTAYRTNLTSLRNNYKERHGLRELTVPQYLSLTNSLEDAVRIADKMLNR